MTMRDVRLDVVREVIAALPQRFDTSAVLRHELFLRGHEAATSLGSVTGRVLSRYSTELGIELVDSSRSPATWRKLPSAAAHALSREEALVDAPPSRHPLSTEHRNGPRGTGAASTEQAPSPPAQPARRGLGPQSSRDDPFTARMRLHQSWWRNDVLQVPYGRGPNASSTTCYGSMLDDEGATRLLNFLDDDIRRVYLEREGSGVEPFRARRNLLSSQPMCFNLFGRLAADLELATRVLRGVLPDVARVTDVRVEWAPRPADQQLADRTSFDAAVDYLTPSGERAFLGVETKLTEPFSPTVHDTPRYRELTERASSPWPRRSWPHVADARWNQLWRNHLLVEAHRQHPASEVTGPARLAVVRHHLDVDCARAVTGYGRLVRYDRLVDLPLDMLHTAVSGALADEAQRRWWSDFFRRYVDVSGSAGIR